MSTGCRSGSKPSTALSCLTLDTSLTSINRVSISQSCCSLYLSYFKETPETPKQGMGAVTFVHTHLGLRTAVFSTPLVVPWRF